MSRGSGHHGGEGDSVTSSLLAMPMTNHISREKGTMISLGWNEETVKCVVLTR